MLLRTLHEFEIIGVFDRGIPNTERIVIRVKEQIQLTNYLLMLGIPVGENHAIPLNFDVFWFGDDILDPLTWIFIYTGPGQRRITTLNNTNDPAVVMHWGKRNTILNNENITPVLVSIEGVLVAPHQEYLSIQDRKT